MMKWIDEIILGLIDKYSTTDIYEICECLNIKIVKLDPQNILLLDRTAYYYRDLEGKEVIFIKNDLSPQLEAFILKHELGHALCHPDLLSAAYTISNKNKLEKQANYFAFKLSNFDFNSIELDGMTLEQISAYTGIPYKVLLQLNE